MLPGLRTGEAEMGSVNVVHDCRGWRTPDESQMDFEAAEEEIFFINM
jgi:hypothetical protein